MCVHITIIVAFNFLKMNFKENDDKKLDNLPNDDILVPNSTRSSTASTLIKHSDGNAVHWDALKNLFKRYHHLVDSLVKSIANGESKLSR